MAIVRGPDGTFYEVLDDQLAKFKIPADKLKDKLGSQATTGGPPPSGGPPEGGTGPLVNVQIYYSGQGAGAGGGGEAAVSPYDWRNWNNWRNHSWRNHHWRNDWD